MRISSGSSQLRRSAGKGVSATVTATAVSQSALVDNLPASPRVRRSTRAKCLHAFSSSNERRYRKVE